jgi:hypothetical protein
LEVVRYVTRKPGDRDYCRDFIDRGNPATNIRVDFLADTSSSMSSDEQALGSAAWAVRTACDRLGAPCSVYTFDTSPALLWDEHDVAPMTPPVVMTGGGTHPGTLFQEVLDLDRDVEEKHHVVLVMTDGQWAAKDNADLARYKAPGRTIILFRYDGYGYGTSGAQQLSDSWGADEAYAINDLLDIPRTLESVLITLGSEL